MSSNLNVFFIIPEDCESELNCELNMQAAFDLCKQYVSSCTWIPARDYEKIPNSKQSVVVFQHFGGDIFKQLVEKNILIIGPQCLIVCLMEKIAIPSCPTPVFMVPMADMVVTCSGISSSERQQLQQQVGYMGGIYTAAFITQTTHLVTNCVNSVKYARACELKIPVMLSSWIDAVWKVALTDNVRADSIDFKDHKCPPFYKLEVTSTGLNHSQRNVASKLITAHGGIYSGKFQSEVTKVLICQPGAVSEKFEAARKNNIVCCTIKWVEDSAACGYALPFDTYRVQKNCASSTFINQNSTRVDPNFSMMSAVTGESMSPKDISETRFNFTNLSTALIGKSTPTPVKEKAVPKTNDAINRIDLKTVKRAGPFLDGCAVYLSGFEPETREKLHKILNLASATRYDVVSERVTHIIIDELIHSEIKQFFQQGRHPVVVSVDWLMESIQLKCPASEHQYKISVSNSPVKNTSDVPPSSPLSKKGVQLLRTDSSMSIPQMDLEDSREPVPQEPNDDLMNEYMQKDSADKGDTLDQFLAAANFNSKCDEAVQNLPARQETLAEESVDASDTITNFFEGLYFLTFGWDDSSTEQVNEMIVNAGGTILTNETSRVADYAVIPQGGVSKKLTANKIVTIFWLEDCVDNNKLLSINYYHKPITVPVTVTPLTGCIITLSTYKGSERSFITWLVEYLGAISEDMLCRKDNKKGIPAATHLICPSPMGSKYSAAVKWGVTIVTHEWLLACASKLKRVDEHLYSVRQSITPDKSELVEANKTESTPKFQKITTDNTSRFSLQKGNSNSTLQNDISKEDSAENCTNSSNSNANNTDFSTPTRSTDDRKNMNDSEFSTKTSSDRKTSSKTETPTNPHIPFQKKLFMNVDSPQSTPNTPTIQNQCSIPKQTMPRPSFGTPLHSQQMTPVAKFLENLRLPKNVQGTPDNSPLPLTPSHVETPDTPLGRCFGNPNPSPETRKYWAKRINALPSYHHTPPLKKPRLDSTPLSELKERLWKKILPKNYYEEQGDSNSENTEIDEDLNPPVSNPVVTAQVEQLKEMLAKCASEEESRKSIRRSVPHNMEEIQQTRRPPVVESQNDTIGWDDDGEVEIPKEATIEPKRFMLSQIAISVRQKIVQVIESLGGLISEQPTLFDETATHLVCSTPVKNEKLLASIASGKWVLHESYITDSSKAGTFLEEDLYEYGNPKATALDSNSPMAAPIYRWRTNIAVTGKRAYHGMKALILMTSRIESVIRLVEAGGGTVVHAEPPYRADITHCFIDPKSLDQYPDCKILASRGVFCLQPIFLNSLLVQDPQPDPREHIIPALSAYYKAKN